MTREERIDALEAQLDSISHELAALRQQQPDEPTETSRREMFKRVALGAAGAAAVGAGTALLGSASPAAAADGSNLVLGQVNTSTAATTVNNSGAASNGAALVVQSGNFYSANGALYSSALAGWASPGGNAPSGVYGFSSQPSGFGVVAFHNNGVGALLRGTTAAVQLYDSGSVSSVASKAHVRGEIIVTDDGDLWYCAASGTPGTLRKLSGPATAGQLHLLAAPVRVYDSRTNKGPASTGDGPLTAAAPSRTIDLKNGYVNLTATPAVPAGATGAMVSLALVNTAVNGYVAAFSNAVSWPGNSSINWSSSGQAIAVTTTSAVDANARIKVQSGGGTGYSTNFIIDVIGYYQ